MKLHLANNAGQNIFTAYGAGFVAVNGVRHERNLAVTPQALREWPATGFAALTERDFEFLCEFAAEVVLLGTGETLRFPAPALLRPLVEAQIGIEVMTTGAACRTYNILAAEGRNVAAAILL